MSRTYIGLATVFLSSFGHAQPYLLPRSNCAELTIGVKTRMSGITSFVNYPGNRARLHLFASASDFKAKRLEDSTILTSLDQLVFKRESIEGKSALVRGTLKCLVPPDSFLPVLHLENAQIESLSLETIERVPETSNSWKLISSKQASGVLHKWIKLSHMGNLEALKSLLEPSEIESSQYFRERLNWLINDSPNAWKSAQIIPSAIRIYRDRDEEDWYYACQFVKQPQFWIGSMPNKHGHFCIQLIKKDGTLFIELSQFDLSYIPKTTVER